MFVGGFPHDLLYVVCCCVLSFVVCWSEVFLVPCLAVGGVYCLLLVVVVVLVVGVCLLLVGWLIDCFVLLVVACCWFHHC